jgi:hypothetical protein
MAHSIEQNVFDVNKKTLSLGIFIVLLIMQSHNILNMIEKSHGGSLPLLRDLHRHAREAMDKTLNDPNPKFVTRVFDGETMSVDIDTGTFILLRKHGDKESLMAGKLWALQRNEPSLSQESCKIW